MPICQKCKTAFPNHAVIQGKRRTMNHRKYCIQCSPFNQHNTRRLHNLKRFGNSQKLCPRCKTIKSAEKFYVRRDGSDLSSYCRACSNQEVVARARKAKQECIDYKGSKCEFCGYCKYSGALDFHHKDPSKKDFNISHRRWSSGLSDEIKKELDKCLLLCSNCHREEHARINGIL